MFSNSSLPQNSIFLYVYYLYNLYGTLFITNCQLKSDKCKSISEIYKDEPEDNWLHIKALLQ